MTKTSYEERGTKFAKFLMKAFFENCDSLADYINAVNRYNRDHVRKLKFAHGVSRFVIIRSDYVIKIEYGTGKDWAGGNENELEIYNLALKDGMAHLLAKPTLIEIDGKIISVMPKINNIRCRKRFWKYCTYEEQAWLYSHVSDLHSGNIGYKKNKICIVDYAYPY